MSHAKRMKLGPEQELMTDPRGLRETRKRLDVAKQLAPGQ